MITVQESQLRYAGAAVIALVGVYKYIGMVAAGDFNYTAIAANAAVAWGVFESGRQSL
ncbi:dld [Symbiodinium pilosum]|uniref:Dld protein n=1 Tax=Symbiodinium pilosum TaxID=2952 RepID=A0A812SQP3_SYMPI|nr:dld [Symbiodinium pilosum]